MWILLALKLTIRITAMGDMVGIKSGRGEKYGEKYSKLIMCHYVKWYEMKYFCCLDLKCFVMFCLTTFC